MRAHFYSLGSFVEYQTLQSAIDVEAEIGLRLNIAELYLKSTMWRGAVQDHIIENHAHLPTDLQQERHMSMNFFALHSIILTSIGL